jgi:hypothetical protein
LSKFDIWETKKDIKCGEKRESERENPKKKENELDIFNRNDRLLKNYC